MKKRFISIILTLSIVMSIFSFPAFADIVECPVCSSTIYDTGFTFLFGSLDVDIYYCSDCGKFLYTDFSTNLGNDDISFFSTGDQSIIEEYVTTAQDGTGGTYETTTDDDGNTTTDFVSNDNNYSWYINSDGLIEVKILATSFYCGGSSYKEQYSNANYYTSFNNGYFSGYYYTDFPSWKLGLYDLYIYYPEIIVPYTGYYTSTLSDYGFFYTDYSSSFTCSSAELGLYVLYSYLDYDSVSLYSSSVSVMERLTCSVDTAAESYYYTSGASGDFLEFYSPIIYLTYDVDSNSELSFVTNDYSSITVNGDVITGDYIYNLDYSTTDSFNSSNYSSAYYVYDNDDSSSYTVYNVDSSTGEIVSSYYYDNSTGDTVTYLTIYESDTFTDDEMYPSSGDDDSSGSGSSGDFSWLTDGLATIFSAIAAVITAVLGGIIELLVSLIDELLSSVTYLIDSLFSLLTSVSDFGGEFSDFLAEFFSFLPTEIVALLCLGLSLSIILMIFKFLRD